MNDFHHSFQRTLDPDETSPVNVLRRKDSVDLLIVIVCYRVPDLTIDCLRSLEGEIVAIPGAHVVVLENGSGEESWRTLLEGVKCRGWERWVSLMPSKNNHGFSGGNNAVLREVRKWDKPPRRVVLLNPDTYVKPGAVQELMKAADDCPEAGIIAPRLENQEGGPEVNCFRYHHPVSEFVRGARTGPVTRLFRQFEVQMGVRMRPVKPPWTSFACVLIRWKVFEQIGLLDEGFFLYFEDVDFCHRAQMAGWEILYWPDACVVHLGGRSGPVREGRLNRGRLPRYFYASRARYFAKHFGGLGLWLSNVLWTIGRSISWLREKLGGRTPGACANEWRDIWIGALHPLNVRPDSNTDDPVSEPDRLH